MWTELGHLEGQSQTTLTTTTTTTTTVSTGKMPGFATSDTSGVGMTLIALVVVFSALVLIFLVFKNIGRLMDLYLSKKEERPLKKEGKKDSKKAAADPAGVIAAITLALHESNSLRHDEEIVEITIQEFSRRYSPWNSKSYAVLHNRLRR